MHASPDLRACSRSSARSAATTSAGTSSRLRYRARAPTTCMATLNTMRAILKDARLREQTGAIRKELAELYKDIERLSERVGNLDRHFGQAAKDIEEIKISSDKAGKRARRLDAFDFEELALPIVPKVPE